MTEKKEACCQEREKELGSDKYTIKTFLYERTIDWIKWTKHKEICQHCKEFRADIINHPLKKKKKKQVNMVALLFKLDKKTKKVKGQLPKHQFSEEELKEVREKHPGASDFYWLDEDGGKIIQVKDENVNDCD